MRAWLRNGDKCMPTTVQRYADVHAGFVQRSPVTSLFWFWWALPSEEVCTSWRLYNLMWQQPGDGHRTASWRQ